MIIHGLGSNVYSLRWFLNRRPLTPAELRQKAAETHSARLRWIKVHIEKLAKIAVAEDRAEADLVEAARLAEEVDRLLDLYASGEV